jgi:hypothetical protein
MRNNAFGEITTLLGWSQRYLTRYMYITIRYHNSGKASLGRVSIDFPTTDKSAPRTSAVIRNRDVMVQLVANPQHSKEKSPDTMNRMIYIYHSGRYISEGT